MGQDVRSTVNTVDLRAAAKDLRNRAASINDDITAAQSKVEGLSSVFQGPTADAYAEVFNNWRQSANQIQQAMEQIGSMLDSLAESYVERETGLAGQIRNSAG